MEWYYAKDGASCGPVDLDELARMVQAGRLKPDDLVWNASMGEEWAMVSTIKDLDGYSPPVVPPQAPEPAAGSVPGEVPIKLVDPVREAWTGMKLVLFQPFDISKWFAIGFAAWLATLGEGGGSSSASSSGRGWSSGGGSSNIKDLSIDGLLNRLEEAWTPVREFFHSYGSIVIAVTVVLVVIIGASGVTFLWLRSRGRFMLLDNVLRNSGEVEAPWRIWRQHGNSLFRWSLVYGLICFVLFLFIMGLSWPLVFKPCITARAFVPSTIGGMVIVGALLFFYSLVTYYIGRFLEDFVVPLMYHRDLTTTEAWGKFMPLYRSHSGSFLLYGLFRLLLQSGAGIAILAVILVTCFIAGCLMAIPYIGAVLLLPVTVFFRLYSVEYLAQYGGDFVVEPAEE
ncbi:MAG: DUF4339 domain-containing protein [Lentisphaerae bacterium]|nr:DUF4339 domain-containing protein [Lentisphaerota bacterium]